MKKNFNEWFNFHFVAHERMSMPCGKDEFDLIDRQLMFEAWKESRRQTLIEILKMAHASYNYDVIDCIRPMLSEVFDNESK